MEEIDIKRISQLISQKLNQNIEITAIEKIGSGYHSDGFKLTAKDGKNFFLKKVKSHDLGFEFPERKVLSLLIGHNMAKRLDLKPRPVGVILTNQDTEEFIPDLSEETEIYHVQEFEGDSIDYWTLLQKKKEKKNIDEQDIKELSGVISFLTKLHSIKHHSLDPQKLKAIYNDALRNMLTNPELTMMLLHDFPEDHAVLPIEKQKEYISAIYELIRKWKDRYDRVVALHGDFWGTNFFFRKDNTTWVIDYSRIPWGDPGIDVGWWLTQYLWFYHETKNVYFKDLGEKFLEMYIEKTGDKEVRKSLSLVMGFIGLVYITPRFFPDLNQDLAKRFLNNIIEIIKNNELLWKM
ncbi:MAG TPA: phosphotransferase [Candidatus Paceibacterota bacterium]|nr:phosphotransferase [Candidatus Paceibacterota bacterium]